MSERQGGMDLEIVYKQEIDLDAKLAKEISALLQKCFREVSFGGRAYFKQLPTGRFLALAGGKLVGHLAVDFRVMNLDGAPIRVFGGMELCVEPRHRRRGIGESLLGEFEKRAKAIKGNVDFLLCATDIPGFYARWGYRKTKPIVMWHRLHQHKSFGIAVERARDCDLMYKRVGRKKWTGGTLDMLGYWY